MMGKTHLRQVRQNRNVLAYMPKKPSNSCGFKLSLIRAPSSIVGKEKKILLCTLLPPKLSGWSPTN